MAFTARLERLNLTSVVPGGAIRTECGLPSSRLEGTSSARRGWSVPLRLRRHSASQSSEPITLGLPFPSGLVFDPQTVVLLDSRQQQVNLQMQVLNRWSDGSIRWLLLDFLARESGPGETHWQLQERIGSPARTLENDLHVYETEEGITVATGAATFLISRRYFQPFQEVLVSARNVLDNWGARTTLTDCGGRSRQARIKRVVLEEKGPVRATLRFECKFSGAVPARLVARLCFFAGTGLVRLRLTLHNPHRAKHPGGLWDLGDPGSMLFRALGLELNVIAGAASTVTWSPDPSTAPQAFPGGKLEIYQESSGGQNWQSRNHVNRHGKVPLSFCGYRARFGQTEATGLRASPIVALRGPQGTVSAAVPEFWQQFPKALEVEDQVLRVGFFPRQFGDGFELQGGERKTHTLWLDFTAAKEQPCSSVGWVHQPTEAIAPPEWYAASGALETYADGFGGTPSSLDILVDEVHKSPNNLLGRRETIDEYGWRDFGEWFADHEGEHYHGPRPVVSHYNNQYDCVLGALLHYLRTGDSSWWQLADPLARHVIDIDRYHTKRDKAAYNGGLFWMTDHYLSAETSTHRTYSRANCPASGQDYGGGPGSSHNFTSGLLLYYFLTGDLEARDTVVGLADWVVAMDDGRNNLLGLLDNGPTGLASFTANLEYHGPGRGAGNSINALLDAWRLTSDRAYLTGAESLIRRCIHPQDDIAAHDLLNAEKRWSYTMFLVALDRYLRLKAECGELDAGYDYAQQSLLAYASWMLDHAAPYLEHRDRLEYVTETWAGQDMRKANVLRLAAAHADEPLRSAMQRRGNELADRAWQDLFSFASRHSTRALALFLVEGLVDKALRAAAPKPAPKSSTTCNHGHPQTFATQRRRVFERLKSWGGRAALCLNLLNPLRWATTSWRF
jgi:hypothetical protein